MRFRMLALLFALFVALSATAAAQTSASVIKVRPEHSSYKVKAGAATPLAVVVEINDGYHINSNRPADKNLIATALKFDRVAGLTVSPVVYPRAKMQKFEFSPRPLSVFEGKAVFKMTARALSSLAAGSQTLRGKLTVQACNNQICLRPEKVDVAIPIEVVK
ncbi:MAG TPA: protein-disulfide reductase DsbD domain-containing protein [Blastocatellia bacterium]|nr:protein-disulfide reductase DsbD domain-containing protein [Blastocatellia bacterium]